VTQSRIPLDPLSLSLFPLCITSPCSLIATPRYQVFVEMRLRQALSSSVTLGVPNVFRTAVVCDAFERVAPMTGRYEGMLVLIAVDCV